MSMQFRPRLSKATIAVALLSTSCSVVEAKASLKLCHTPSSFVIPTPAPTTGHVGKHVRANGGGKKTGPTRRTHQPSSRTSTSTRESALKVSAFALGSIFEEILPSTLVMPFASAATANSPFPASATSLLESTSCVVGNAARTLACDTELEAEILTDISHVALDLGTFLLAPDATVTLRFITFLGRILLIVSESLADHPLPLEEWAFQGAMLTVSAVLLLKSLLPLLPAAFAETSVDDRRVYHHLFRKRAGLSWVQFKAISFLATEWITVAPQESVSIDDDSLYWLHRGDAAAVVAVSSTQELSTQIFHHPMSSRRSPRNETFVSSSSATSDATSLSSSSFAASLGSFRMLGEHKFAQRLALQDNQKKKKNSTMGPRRRQLLQDCCQNATSKALSPTMLVAGNSGAVLLKIHTTPLLRLMENDEHLAQSIRSLVWGEMQHKLDALLLLRGSSYPGLP